MQYKLANTGNKTPETSGDVIIYVIIYVVPYKLTQLGHDAQK